MLSDLKFVDMYAMKKMPSKSFEANLQTTAHLMGCMLYLCSISAGTTAVFQKEASQV